MGHRFECGGPLWRCIYFDTVTNDDLVAMWEKLDEAEARVTEVPHRLVDLSGATRAEVDFGNVAEAARQRREREFPNFFRSAIVAPTPMLYGYARMFQTLNSNPKIEIQLFQDEAGALRWLGQRESGTVRVGAPDWALGAPARRG